MLKNRKNSADLFVQCLQSEGIEYIFGVPGEENLHFLEALRKSNIKFIVTRNEQAAVFMAATVGRLTGHVGVALSTLGPGATNLITGVAYAQLGGMPLLVITGQKSIRKNKQGKFQIIDAVRVMQPLTKYSNTIESVDRIPSMIREAIKIAETERPGAVHLELPEDIASEPSKSSLKPIYFEKVRRPAPDPKSIDKAVNIIENSKNPLIIVGAGANRKLIRKQLLYFLEKTKIPFITTQMGKGVEDENSDLYIGTTALSSGDYVHKALMSADTIIMLGHDTIEKPPIILTPDTHNVIHINFSVADIDDVYIPTHEIIGDISHTLWMLAEKIKIQKKWNFNFIFKIRDALQKNIELGSKKDNFPILPTRIVSDVYKAMPEDGVLALDNGMYKIWFARNYKARRQNSVLLDNALATMGAGLSSGIATKIIFPNKKVLVVSGDGGIMMNIAEIETAHRLGIDLTILILTDSEFGMIRWKQANMSMSNFGLNFTNPDFEKLAESFGARGYKIKKSDELLKVLKNSLNSKGIHIIDCPVDYSQSVNDLGVVLTKEIKKI